MYRIVVYNFIFPSIILKKNNITVTCHIALEIHNY